MKLNNKNELFINRQPIIKELEKIEAVVMPGTDCKAMDGISLRNLFSREEMDNRNVDSLMLTDMAKKLLKILMELSQCGITPGVISLTDIMLLKDGSLRIIHPERFQLSDYHQDYEWFPEDEKLYAGKELFDTKDQLMADNRLIYKVLIASKRGNVRIPPTPTETDYSEVFYKTLPKTFVESLMSGKSYSYRQLMDVIENVEKNRVLSAERLCNDTCVAKEAFYDVSEKDKGNTYPLNVLYIIMRTDYKSSKTISRMLYELSDKIEAEGECGMDVKQAYVYGDGAVITRDYRAYKEGFRCQFRENILPYSKGEALILGANMTRQSLKKNSGQEHRIYILVEGIVKNDTMFHAGVKRIKELCDEGVGIHLISADYSECEAIIGLRSAIS